MHLTCLPSAYGIGELGDRALRFIDDLVTLGLSVWQFLPTGPVTYADSPYQCSSIYAGNPLLIDLAALRDDGLIADSELSVFDGLPRRKVRFSVVIPLKTQLLARVAERFGRAATPAQRAGREEFVATNDREWLHNFALFEVLKTMHQRRAWSEWDPAYAARDPEALRTLESAAHAHIDGVKTVQFLFYEQWGRLRAYAADRGIRLMGDLPIYIALDSADAWERPELLCLDENRMPTHVAGVPPDYFSADGQRWGNPLYRWDRHRADGFDWWISRVRHAMTMFDLIRLDHFRGFEAYWAVAAEAGTAREGEWRPGPGEALFDALRDALGDLPIVAEDLGIITPEVEALRERYGFPGMKVLQFMVGDSTFDPQGIPENCVCYTGTHDNDTTVGWFNGAPGDRRTPEEVERSQSAALEHTGGVPGTIHDDLIRLAFSTRAELAIAPMQDYLGLGSGARMNTPGTAEGNWRWRLRDEDMTEERSDTIRRMVVESGRCCGTQVEEHARET